jgi:hypothetical protein
MRLRSLVVFGIGYVAGTRAGRERYAQITAAAGKAAERLGRLEPASGAAERTVRLDDYLQDASANGARRS